MSAKRRKAPHLNGPGRAGRKHLARGSYFLSLELENVRCFSERRMLDLADGNGRPARWTILLGENGTGKTTILQLLVALESPIIEQEGLSTSHYQRRLPYVTIPVRTMTREPQGPNQLAVAKVAHKTRLTDHGDRPESSSQPLVVTEHGISSGINDKERLPPTCYAYGAARRTIEMTLSNGRSNDAEEIFFTDDTRLRNAEDWLLRLDYSVSKRSSVQERQARQLETVKDVLIKVLPDVSEIRFDASSGVMPRPTVQFKTPYGWVPLQHLGYGYRTMLAWIVDLASRMVERYPDSPDPLADPAVVLVDEIDMHLHPKWQRELIGFLTERFPNTQFIVTAHSPLIVQAATDANIAVLKREGDHVVIENHPETIRGWRVDQVLTNDLFGLETARPPDMEKLLLRRKELLTKSRLTAADKKELKSLDSQLGPIPTGESFEQAKTMELIKESLDLLKKYQGSKP